MATAVSVTCLWEIDAKAGGRKDRTTGLRTLLDYADSSKIALVVLPAGFWSVENEEEVEPLAREIQGIVKGTGVAVVAGVDLAMLGALKRGPTKKMVLAGEWRQTTIKSVHVVLPVAVNARKRLFKVGNNKALALQASRPSARQGLPASSRTGTPR